MSRTSSRSFTWVPGEGPDEAALEWMAQAFRRPAEPMGEAWFMSAKRKMYPQLLGDLDAVPDGDLGRALEEIASGTVSFGPSDEWTKWFHYLLAPSITRRWQPTYFDMGEVLLTAFMTQHPSPEGKFPYDGFRSDALATLGRYVMSPRFWPDGRVDVVRCLGKWKGPSGIAGWFDAGGLLSASLFFSIKYLPTDQVEPWFRSVIAIPDLHWKVQVAIWLVGAYPILSKEISQPSEFPQPGSFGIGWSWSHILGGDYTGQGGPSVAFLPDANGSTILRCAREWDVEDTLDDFMTSPDMQDEAWEARDLRMRFLELYR